MIQAEKNSRNDNQAFLLLFGERRFRALIYRGIRIIKIIDVHAVFFDFGFLGHQVVSTILAVVVNIARLAAWSAVNAKVGCELERDGVT